MVDREPVAKCRSLQLKERYDQDEKRGTDTGLHAKPGRAESVGVTLGARRRTLGAVRWRGSRVPDSTAPQILPLSVWYEMVSSAPHWGRKTERTRS